MPKVSQTKKDRISEQILHFLFTVAPQSRFTADVARELARDEEFTKVLLSELQRKKLIVQIAKNAQGTDYLRRKRWRLSNEAYEAYRKHQSPSRPNTSFTDGEESGSYFSR